MTLKNYDSWKTTTPETSDIENEVYSLSTDALINEYNDYKRDKEAHYALLADIVHLKGLIRERYDLDDDEIYAMYKNTVYFNEMLNRMREYVIDERLNGNEQR